MSGSEDNPEHSEHCEYRKKIAFKLKDTPSWPGDFGVTLNNFDMLALSLDLTLMILYHPLQTMLEWFLSPGGGVLGPEKYRCVRPDHQTTYPLQFAILWKKNTHFYSRRSAARHVLWWRKHGLQGGKTLSRVVGAAPSGRYGQKGIMASTGRCKS